MWLRAAGIGLVVLLSGCLEATQVTFKITTDIPCDRVNGTSITVGLLGETEAADPREVIRQCRQDGTVGIIGIPAFA